MKTRIYFLDNLRTFLIFLVVLLHAGLVYESVLENTWIVCDPVKNNSIGLVRMYLDLFVMFSLFFISGYFIPNSVKRKNNRDFLKSKFKRILLPWIVAVFTLIPAYKAIFLYSRGLPQEEWFSYFHLFQRTGGDLSFFADNPTQNWLWFLPVLFLFQVLYLALSRTNLLSIKISLKTGVVLTFVIGLIYSMVISSYDLRGWFHSPILHFQRERLLVYFMIFLLGSLCNKLKIFESNNKNKKYYILSNVVLMLSLSIFTVVALNFFFNMIDPERNYFFISGPIDRILYYSSLLLSMLSFLQILIHIFRFHFNKTSKLLVQLSKNSYYVYIIHVIVIGLIALILLNISIPAIVKYFILAIFTYIFSNFIVYGYRGIFHRIISMKSVIATMLVVILVTFAFCGKQKNIDTENQQPTASGTTTILPGKGLHEAALTGDIEVIQQHIKAGSDLNEKESRGGSTPLITAATFGQTEVAIALIEAGADVNFKNNEGSTPLHTAAFFCRTEIVKALLTNGADKNIKNNAGSTALEAVAGPFDDVKGIYDYLGTSLGSLGLKLDYEQIKMTRPKITEMLR
ncbi:MAG: acyltransferase family protein [Bacteroidetes bacterium]|nr:acyltransferase family protein [Bacteroidota bacterium]MCK4360966.1 acyltransferase family protein [Bacteroidales bacterium]